MTEFYLSFQIKEAHFPHTKAKSTLVQFIKLWIKILKQVVAALSLALNLLFQWSISLVCMTLTWYWEKHLKQSALMLLAIPLVLVEHQPTCILKCIYHFKLKCWWWINIAPLVTIGQISRHACSELKQSWCSNWLIWNKWIVIAPHLQRRHSW